MRSARARALLPVVAAAAAALVGACGGARPRAPEPPLEMPPGPPPDAAPAPIRATLAGIPVGALVGRVLDAGTGSGLDLVRVKAIAPGQRGPRLELTSTDGRFLLNNLRVMTYDVVFAREGGPELTITGVEIPQGAAARICVRLGQAAATLAWDAGARCDDPDFRVVAP